MGNSIACSKNGFTLLALDDKPGDPEQLITPVSKSVALPVISVQ